MAWTAPDQSDEGVGFLGGAIDAIGPTFAGVSGEEEVNFAPGGGRKSGVLKSKVNRVVIGAFAKPDENVFLLFLGQGEERIGRRQRSCARQLRSPMEFGNEEKAHSRRGQIPS